MAEVDQNGAIFVGKGETTALLSLAFSNRHGLVTGARVCRAPAFRFSPPTSRAIYRAFPRSARPRRLW